MSQVNHRPHSNLHGPENGEPADVEADEYDADAPAHSVVFLLHSAQPLSYIANLIRAEGPSPEPSQYQIEQEQAQPSTSSKSDDKDHVTVPQGPPSSPDRKDKRQKFDKEQFEMRQMLLREGFLDPLGDPPISFHTRAADGKRWSPATGIGDFLRDAARVGSFVIRIGERNVYVTVPSFEDRTRFLRGSLYAKTEQIEHLVKLKADCDRIAHAGTKRISLAGVAILTTWWGTVAFLTFCTSLGWDVMEPVTYLTGLGTILGGYIWFLIHNREVSYRAVSTRTTSRRQQKLYIEKGFNVERYQELIEEVKDLRKTIKKVAEDYDLEWDQGETKAASRTRRRSRSFESKKQLPSVRPNVTPRKRKTLTRTIRRAADVLAVQHTRPRTRMEMVSPMMCSRIIRSSSPRRRRSALARHTVITRHLPALLDEALACRLNFCLLLARGTTAAARKQNLSSR